MSEKSMSLKDINAIVDNNDFLQNLEHLQKVLDDRDIKDCKGVTSYFFEKYFDISHIGFAPLYHNNFDILSEHTAGRFSDYLNDMDNAAKKNEEQYSATYESNDVLMKIAMVHMSAYTKPETFKNMDSAQLLDELENHMFDILGNAFDTDFIVDSMNEASHHLFPHGDRAMIRGKGGALVNVNILNQAVEYMDNMLKEANEIIHSAEESKEEKLFEKEVPEQAKEISENSPKEVPEQAKEISENSPKTDSNNVEHIKFDDGIEGWSKDGKKVRTIYPDGTEIKYDNKERVVFVKDNNGIETEIKYNEEGNAFCKDSLGREWIQNSKGQKLYSKDNDGTESWYENGIKKKEYSKNGLITEYHSNGEIAAKYQKDCKWVKRYYENGLPDYFRDENDFEQEWYRNGNKKLEKGPDGTEKRWDEEGNLMWKTEKDREGNLCSYDGTGKLQSKVFPDGTKHSWYNGRLVEEFKDGTRMEWHPDGSLYRLKLPNVGSCCYKDVDFSKNKAREPYEVASIDINGNFLHFGCPELERDSEEVVKHFKLREKSKNTEWRDDEGNLRVYKDVEGNCHFYDAQGNYIYPDKLKEKENSIEQNNNMVDTKVKETPIFENKEPKISDKKEHKEPEIKETAAPKKETQQQEKISDEPTKAYRDFGEILKDKSLTEEEQMWYLNGLIEEEKEQLAKRAAKAEKSPETKEKLPEIKEKAPEKIQEMSKEQKREALQSLRGIGNKSNNTVTNTSSKTIAKTAETNPSKHSINISTLKSLRGSR